MFNTTKHIIKNDLGGTIIDDIKAKYTREFSKSFGEKSSADYIDKIKMKYMESGSHNTKVNTDKLIEEKMRKYRIGIKNDCLNIENGAKQNPVKLEDDSNQFILDKLKSIEETLNKIKKEKEIESNLESTHVINTTDKNCYNKDKDTDNTKFTNKKNNNIMQELSEVNIDNIIPLVERISKLKNVKNEHESKCHKKYIKLIKT
jgi:hypothetical protein